MIIFKSSNPKNIPYNENSYSCSLILLLLVSCSPEKPNIVEWRGEDRNGRYHENNLLKEWPEEGPAELWFLDGIGSGYGSPVIEDGLIYITGAIDSIAYLHCIDTRRKNDMAIEIRK